MAAEFRVSARDGSKWWEEGRMDEAEERKRERRRIEKDGSEGFLFQISAAPQGASVLVASSIPK